MCEAVSGVTFFLCHPFQLKVLLWCQRPHFPHKGCPQKHFDIEVISRAFIFSLYSIVQVNEHWRAISPPATSQSVPVRPLNRLKKRMAENIDNIPTGLRTYCCSTTCFHVAVTYATYHHFFLLSNKYFSINIKEKCNPREGCICRYEELMKNLQQTHGERGGWKPPGHRQSWWIKQCMY